MSISWKKTSTLVNEFLKNPREFENYVKGCLDSLNKINYLKITQFDENIDDYSYFKCLSGAIPFNIYLAFLFKEYREKMVEQIPNENIINVKTNIFYGDNIKTFLEANHGFNAQGYNKHYSRMICTILVNPSELCKDNSSDYTSDISLHQQDRIYTISELLNMVQNNKIFIIDNFVQSDDISEKELLEGLKNGTIVLQEANLNWVGLDNKVHADFLSCKNEYDKMVWQTIYAGFLDFIRKDKIYCDDTFSANTSGYNLSWFFYQTIKQLEEIFSKIKSVYQKKKKPLPDSYAKAIREASDIINMEKSRFQDSPKYKESQSPARQLKKAGK